MKKINISEEEINIANKLITKFLEHKEQLPYANIGSKNEYLGWVNDFKLKDLNNNKIILDLKKENDLFLLFVLAVVWSRTGQWENSAFFVSYLKVSGKDSVSFWAYDTNYLEESDKRKINAERIFNQLSGIIPRKKINFREDIFNSIHLLANKWSEILLKLNESEKENNYNIFISFIRNIEGLGVGNKKIMIKIPLILRELRCQNIYSNIPGEYCCVPDARVIDTCKEIGISISNATSLEYLLRSSTKIYSLFGDLYDLPLFAYEDLEEISKVESSFA